MTKILTVISFALLFSVATNAQSPGGINTQLELWLKADAGVIETSGDISVWADQSGSGMDGTAYNTPVLTENANNFNPAVTFTRANSEYFDLPDGFDDFSSGVSAYVVAKTSSTAADWERFFDFGNGASSNNIMLGRYIATDGFYYEVWNGAVSDQLYVSNVLVADQNNIYNIIQAGGTAGESNIPLFFKNGLDLENTGDTYIAQNVTRTVNYVGRSNWSGDAYYGGEISEIILFSNALTDIEHQQIQSYLAVKYGISIDQTTAHDYLGSDGSSIWISSISNGYNNAIFSVGADAGSGLNQRVSKSSSADGIVTLALESDFDSSNEDASRTVSTDDLAFEFIANDGNDESWTNTDSPSGFLVLNRKWMIQEVGSVDGVFLQFDVDDADFDVAGLSAGDAYYLAIDEDGDGDFSDAVLVSLTETAVGSGLWYTAEEIDFTSQQLFTLATAESGSSVWTGSTGGYWNNASNWSTGTLPAEGDIVEIPSGSSPIIQSTDEVKIAYLDIADDDVLVIESDADNSGSLIVTGGFTGGEIQYKRYLPEAAYWHLISAPTTNQELLDFYNDNTDSEADILDKEDGSNQKYALAPYNNSTASWDYYNSSTIGSAGELVSAKGYQVKTTAGGLLSFTGGMNVSDVNIQLTSYSGEGQKWNLVGNPYPSAISMDSVMTINEDIFTDLSMALYVWDGQSGVYEAVNYATNGLDDYLVAPGQGFFVYTYSNLKDFKFTRNMQVTSSEVEFKSASLEPIQLTLKAKNTSGNQGSARVMFMNNATKGIDKGYDAKNSSLNNAAVEVFTQLVADASNAEELSIQCLPEDGYNYSIPVGISSSQSGNITFSLDAASLPGSLEVYLEDNVAGASTLLSNDESYTVYIPSGKTDYGRFYLKTSSVATGVTNVNSDFSITPIVSEGKLAINGSISTNTSIEVLHVSGRRVFMENIEADETSVAMPDMAGGVYVVIIRQNENSYVQKILW